MAAPTCPDCNNDLNLILFVKEEWSIADKPDETGYVDTVACVETTVDDSIGQYLWCATCAQKFNMDGTKKEE